VESHGRWAQQEQQQQAPQQYQPAPTAPAPAAPATTDMGDTIAQLKELAQLKEQGVLTDAEFEAQKARILDS
jgi:hypothetical protein